jgi:hypothetical protein
MKLGIPGVIARNLVPAELVETEHLAFGGGIDLDHLAALDDLQADHVLAQDVLERPGDHVAERVVGGRLLRRDAADPRHRLLGDVELADRLADRDVGEAGREPHAVDERRPGLDRLLVQPVAVAVERKTARQLEPLDLVGVGPPVVLLEHVDDRQARLDRGVTTR